jgi:hypothetical protein
MNISKNNRIEWFHNRISSLLITDELPNCLHYSIHFISLFQTIIIFTCGNFSLSELSTEGFDSLLSGFRGAASPGSIYTDLQIKHLLPTILLLSIYYIIICFLLLGGTAILTGKRLPENQAKILWILALLHCEVFSFVINFILGNFLYTCLQTYNLQTGAFIVLICLLIINNLLGLLFANFTINPFISTQPFTTKSSINQVLDFITKNLMCFIFVLQDYTCKWKVISIIGMISGLIRSGILYSNFLYYNLLDLQFKFFSSTFTFLMSLFLLISSLDINHSINLIYYQIILYPIIWKLSAEGLRLRLKSCIIGPKEKFLNKNHDFGKRIMASDMILNFAKNVHKNDEDSIYVINLIQEHASTCASFNCPCHSSLGDGQGFMAQFELKNLSTVLVDAVLMSILTQASKHLKSTEVTISLAYLQLKYLNSSPVALATLKSLSLSNNILNHIIAKRLKEMIHEKLLKEYESSNSNKLNIRDFMNYQTKFNDLINQMTEISKSHVEFWQIFEKPDYRINEILALSQKIDRRIEMLERDWRVFDQAFFNSYRIYPKYAFFLAAIKNAPSSAEKLLQNYRRKLATITDEKSIEFTESAFHDKANIVCHISLGKTNAGTILEISSNISTLGWNSNFLIGKHISLLLPPMIQNNFRTLVQDFFENQTTGKYLDTPFMCFLRNVEGYIILSEGYIAINPYFGEEMTLIIIFKVKQTTTEYILLKNTHIIDSMSPKIAQTLKVTPNKNIQMSDICPQYSSQVKRQHTKNLKLNSDCGSASGSINTSPESLGTNQCPCLIRFLPVGSKNKKAISHFYLYNTHEFKLLDLNITVLELMPYFTSKTRESKLTSIFGSQRNYLPKEDETQEYVNSNEIEENMNNHRFREPMSPSGSANIYQGFQVDDVLARSSEFNADQMPKLRNSSKIAQNIPEASEHDESEVPTPSLSSTDHVEVKMRERIEPSHSIPSSTRSANYKQIEESIHALPKQKSTLVLSALALWTFLITCGLLISYFIYSNNNFSLIESNMTAMALATGQLTRVLQEYRYAMLYSLFDTGLYERNRFAPVDWYSPTIRRFAYNIANVLQEKSSDFLQAISPLGDDLKKRIFKADIPVVDKYDRSKTHYVDLFTLTTEVVIAGKTYVHGNISVTNPDLNFVVENAVGGLLTKLETMGDLLKEDCENKMNEIVSRNVTNLAIILSLGIFIIILFLARERVFVQQKDNFLNVMSMIDERSIQKNLEIVTSSLPLLSENSQNSYKLMEKYQNLYNENTKSLAKQIKGNKTMNMKRLLNLKGVGLDLLVNLGLFLLFTLLLLSGFFALQIAFTIGGKKDELLSYFQRQYDTGYGYYELRLITMSLYAYIKDNGTSTIRNEPISTEWERLYDRAVNYQNYLAKLIPYYRNETVRDLINGDLCLQNLSGTTTTASSIASCRTKMEGMTTKGLIGINSYLLSGIRGVKDLFDNSPRTRDDMIQALNYTQFQKTELQDTNFFVAGYDRLIEAQILETNQRENEIQILILSIIIAFLVVDAIFGVLLWRKISNNLKSQRITWTKLIRRIPFTVILNSKILKSYIRRHSKIFCE